MKAMLEETKPKRPTKRDLRGRQRVISKKERFVPSIETVTVIMKRALCEPMAVSLPRVKFLEGPAP
jgi:hypothetical protein